MDIEAALIAQMVKNSSAVWETWVLSLGWEDLEKRMATHSSILAILENCIGRGAWQATVHGFAKSQTQFCDFHYACGHPDTPEPFLKRLSFSFLNYVKSN